jgi:uncharacterized membrane protein YphA (DoxX/SURF4 family)
MRALPRLLTHRILLRVIQLGLGVMFIYASADKIGHPDRFADIVHEYDMLPLFLVNAFALAMPAVEIVTGAALLLGCWRRAAGLLAAALCLAFLVAIAQARIRGLDIECGCFDVSGMSATKATWDLFLRDIGLLLASALVWRRA